MFRRRIVMRLALALRLYIAVFSCLFLGVAVALVVAAVQQHVWFFLLAVAGLAGVAVFGTWRALTICLTLEGDRLTVRYLLRTRKLRCEEIERFTDGPVRTGRDRCVYAELRTGERVPLTMIGWLFPFAHAQRILDDRMIQLEQWRGQQSYGRV